MACEISFKIVEYPFFIDFIKELNATYNLPSRDYLSGCLFKRELTNVNDNTQSDLSKQNDLMLGK